MMMTMMGKEKNRERGRLAQAIKLVCTLFHIISLRGSSPLN